MHAQGTSAWFSDGQEEREFILKIGESWNKLQVLEIGCGEGALGMIIRDKGAEYLGLDYSKVAIYKATQLTKADVFIYGDYRMQGLGLYQRIVMQGVLEHLDNPFAELKWMIDNLLIKGGDVITSSPCFLNPRGIIWMTLNLIGAVMSKTDRHFLNPWDFWGFAMKHDYHTETQYCDEDWGNDAGMLKDLAQRIPLALKDGNIDLNPAKFNQYLQWLTSMKDFNLPGYGATAIYKIKT